MNLSPEFIQTEFLRLKNIMDELRAKCPWDKEQTFDSVRHLTIEETHELSEAILKQNPDEIKKELGDLLLHVVFYSKMAEEKGWFSLGDVIHAICEKLIRRHPHIYGNVKADDPDAVKSNWEQIKQNENKENRSVLDGVPSGLPSLIKSYRIQEKASAVGFDWDKPEQVLDKVKEELEEFEKERRSGTKEKAKEEFGDVLFALVNYARLLSINPDDALEKTNRKFIKRFQYLENKSKTINKTLKEMTLDEMNAIWEEAKFLE
ncbi:MAG: nucleoside triphosphate pyrophosphohydrolase [Bacteroidia bacterium]|nr:nucleoside triphosphate pyrophosphohydrolase [Bacteroidia bacterium]